MSSTATCLPKTIAGGDTGFVGALRASCMLAQARMRTVRASFIIFLMELSLNAYHWYSHNAISQLLKRCPMIPADSMLKRQFLVGIGLGLGMATISLAGVRTDRDWIEAGRSLGLLELLAPTGPVLDDP